MGTQSLTIRGLATIALVTSVAAIAAAPASAVGPTDFSITTLSTSNPTVFDAGATAGDDRGYVALTGDRLLWRGDDAGVSLLASDLTDPVTSSTWSNMDLSTAPSAEGDLLVTDFSNLVAYDLIGSYDVAEENWTTTGLRVVGANSEYSGSTIDLSQDIVWESYFDDNLEEDHYCGYLASGAGRIAVWDICLGKLYDINPATGVVTVVNNVADEADVDGNFFDINSGETDNSIASGVLEVTGGNYSVVFYGDDAETGDGDEISGLYRVDLSTPANPVELVLELGDGDDISSFVVNPADGSWYFHAEGASGVLLEQIGDVDGEELLVRFGPAALANTGVDASLLAGLALTALASGGVLVARRRRA